MHVSTTASLTPISIIWEKYEKHPEKLKDAVACYFAIIEEQEKKIPHYKYNHNKHEFGSYRFNTEINGPEKITRIFNDIRLHAIRDLVKLTFDESDEKVKKVVTEHLQSLILGKKATLSSKKTFIKGGHESNFRRFNSILKKIQNQSLRVEDLEIIPAGYTSTAEKRKTNNKCIPETTRKLPHVKDVFKETKEPKSSEVKMEPTKEKEPIEKVSHKKKTVESKEKPPLERSKSAPNIKTYFDSDIKVPGEKMNDQKNQPLEANKSKPFILFRPFIFLFNLFMSCFKA